MLVHEAKCKDISFRINPILAIGPFRGLLRKVFPLIVDGCILIMIVTLIVLAYVELFWPVHLRFRYTAVHRH